MSHPCDAKCGRFFGSIKAMHSHLTAAKSCSWYGKGKLRDLGLSDTEDEVDMVQPTVSDNTDDIDLEGYDQQQDSDINDIDFGPYGEEYHFLPNDEPGQEDLEGAAGPGPSTVANRIIRAAVLDDDDDECVTVIDEEAGRIYRQDAPPRYIPIDEDGDAVMGDDSEPNPFTPFSSELDWRVAQWAVKDGPGHNAFDRLLKIPGVREFYLCFF